MTIDLSVVAVFLLVLARTSAWVMTAPLFSSKGIAGTARLAMAIGLSLFLAPLATKVAPPTDPIAFAGVALGQVLIGLGLGWITGLFFSVFEMAGSMIDASSGMAIASQLDPVSGNQNAVYARFTNVLFMTLLVVTNAHLTLVAGFVRSFSAVPADQFPVLSAGSAGMAGRAVAGLMVAALEIAAPVLGALFLTEVALALAARFAPQANVFAVGLPLKMLVSLLAMGTALVLLPSRVPGLVDNGVQLGRHLFG